MILKVFFLDDRHFTLLTHKYHIIGVILTKNGFSCFYKENSVIFYFKFKLFSEKSGFLLIFLCKK